MHGVDLPGFGKGAQLGRLHLGFDRGQASSVPALHLSRFGSTGGSCALRISLKYGTCLPRTACCCASGSKCHNGAYLSAEKGAAALKFPSRCSSGGSAAHRKICILWFKKDLRMDDHPGLVAAASGYDTVLPLFVFDPVLFRGWSQVLIRALVDAVTDLRTALQGIGSDLVIRSGSTEDAILRLAQQVKATDVFTEEEIEDDLESLTRSTWNTLSVKCARVPVLRKWRTSLYTKQDFEILPDAYDKYKGVQGSVNPPLEAPVMLPFLPDGVHKGSLPSVKDLEIVSVLKQPRNSSPSLKNCFKKEGAKERLAYLLQQPETAKQNVRHWLERYLTWFTKTEAKSMVERVEKRTIQLLEGGATGALNALRAYIQFSEPVARDDWRMLHECIQQFQKIKGNSFRPIFGTALTLGTISLRRIYHEALCHSKKRWLSSHIVAAAAEEVKLIEWYKFLAIKSRLQGSQNGWNVKTWKWRGFLIQYTCCGDQGHAVVLVHGFGAFWEHYRDNIKELANKGNRVWALTMLGFGRSEKPSIVYTELLWSELLRDFIVEVVGEPAVLVGNSLGGYVASLVSGLWPTLVKSLVLLNAAGIVVPDYQSIENPKVMERTGIPRASSELLLFFLQQQCAVAFRRCYPSNSERIDKWLLDEAMRASYDPGATSVLESMFYLRLPLPLNFLLDQYNGKTLLVQGIFDPLQNAFKKAQTLQACCKNITVSIVNAGHCPHDEVPEEVNRLISDWVKDTCPKHCITVGEDKVPDRSLLDHHNHDQLAITCRLEDGF